ncbi:DUF1858 domain-containing protein [Mesorhizobium sp. B2-3-5]|uniref:DUF1858 domain-containing protein n=1 Tax=Mesorhizobium sp. B2-3-5 TaxID=2589958 RepID=UPI001126343C|nr:DUF1858 domain-containing protein [Mesorhizobium sp. B2-3-5]TPM18172.1 DUF1858 domain-containing protein [Mesorhizobium sp. B2-3-5]
MAVDEMMRRWPASISVILKHGMLCTGCPIAPFHSIAEACRDHRVMEQDFLADLHAHLAMMAIDHSGARPAGQGDEDRQRSRAVDR